MWWVKLLGTFSLLLSVLSSVTGQQETFSKRYSLGANNLLFRSVSTLGSDFLAIGPVFGEDPFVYNGTQLAVFSQLGDLIDSSRLISPTSRVESWATQNTLGDNNEVFFTGNNYDRGRSFFIGKFSEESRMPSYSVYRNPEFPESSFTFAGGILSNQSRFFLFGGIDRSDSDINTQQGIILEFNSSLEFLDTIYFPSGNQYSYQFRDIIRRESGGYYGFVQVNEVDEQCEPIQQFIVYQLDDNFGVISSYSSPDEEAWQDGRIYEDDNGDLYIQSAEVDYRNFTTDPDNCFSTALFSPRLVKLDSNLNRIWTKNLNREVDTLGAYTGIAEILPASDGPGMVAVSSQYSRQTRMAHLIRFDTAGNKLWHRTYGFFDTTETNVFVYDAKVANDGGYVLVGEARVKRTQENLDLGRFPTQQGWIMKVDEEGCLIPGCGSEAVITSVGSNTVRPVPSVVLFPNPVGDMLMFRLEGIGSIKKLAGEIYDVSGRLIRSIPERRLAENMTLMLDVDELEPGIYFLRLRLGDGRLLSQKFIKQ